MSGWLVRCRGLIFSIVAGTRDGVTESLIGLVDQLCPRFRLPVQVWRMAKAIRMPDLDLFKPGFFDVSVRCRGQEFKQRIEIGRLVVLHRSLP